jgi:hypothetical protein
MPKDQRRCARCRAEIPAERLEILPETRLCIACSRAIGGEFDVTLVSENLAKSGSLKKNYGSFSLRKRRRHIEPLPE